MDFNIKSAILCFNEDSDLKDNVMNLESDWLNASQAAATLLIRSGNLPELVEEELQLIRTLALCIELGMKQEKLEFYLDVEGLDQLRMFIHKQLH